MSKKDTYKECKKHRKNVFDFVLLFVIPSLLIPLTNCQKGQMRLPQLCSAPKTLKTKV